MRHLMVHSVVLAALTGGAAFNLPAYAEDAKPAEGTKIVDELADLKKLESSENVQAVTQGADWKGTDKTVLSRKDKDKPAFAIYKADAISGATIVVYFHTDHWGEHFSKVFISADKKEWTEVGEEAVNEEKFGNFHEWHKGVISVKELPAGTKYLKLQWKTDVAQVAFSPLVGKVTIETAPAAAPVAK